jgi:hypothetical protein
VTSIDIDDDGDLDLAVASVGQGTVTIGINNGSNSFTEAGYTGVAGPGYFIRSIHLGPADAGEEGLIISSYHTSNVTILRRSCEL